MRLQALAEPLRNIGARPVANLPLDKNTTDAALMADAVALLGAGLYSMGPLDVGLAGYFTQTLELLTPRDVWEGVSKSVVFGVLITLIGTSVGFSVSGGAEGVGRATTRAVVMSISALVVADMLFSFFLNR